MTRVPDFMQALKRYEIELGCKRTNDADFNLPGRHVSRADVLTARRVQLLGS